MIKLLARRAARAHYPPIACLRRKPLSDKLLAARTLRDKPGRSLPHTGALFKAIGRGGIEVSGRKTGRKCAPATPPREQTRLCAAARSLAGHHSAQNLVMP